MAEKFPMVISTGSMSFLNQAKALGDLPSIIILDLNMPGIDGKTARTFKEGLET